MDVNISRIINVSVLQCAEKTRECVVIAHGKVPSSGWTLPKLIPHLSHGRDKREENDEVLCVDFVAQSPNSAHLPLETDIWAQLVATIPATTKALKIFGLNNSYSVELAVN